VQSQDLPVLSNSASMGTPQAMPATQTFAPMPSAPAAVALGATPGSMPMPAMPGAASSAGLPVNSAVPVAAPVTATGGAYTHTIASGESLYTIARRYDVTTQALVQANNLSSPDKTVVGQSIVIPGRPDLLRTPQNSAPTQVAAIAPKPAQAPAPLAQPTAQPAPVVATVPTTQ